MLVFEDRSISAVELNTEVGNWISNGDDTVKDASDHGIKSCDEFKSIVSQLGERLDG